MEAEGSTIQTEGQETTTKRCTNCSRGPQPLEAFTKDGKVMKRCLKCREKDSNRAKRPDVREKKYAANKRNKPWIAYRQRQREQGERAFLDHNNEVARNWRANNNEHVREWYRTNLNFNWDANMRSAREKGITVELSEEEFKGLMQQLCGYCGFLDEKKGFGGVDRLNSKLHYTKDNTMSCCKTCNFMKISLDPVTFINRARHIAAICTDGAVGEEHREAWPQEGRMTQYWSHKSSAATRHIECTLSLQDHEELVADLCAYCGGQGGGVDRKDSTIGYTIENCVPCCAECNYMKKVLNVDDFCDKLTEIAEFWEGHEFPYEGPRVIKCVS